MIELYLAFRYHHKKYQLHSKEYFSYHLTSILQVSSNGGREDMDGLHIRTWQGTCHGWYRVDFHCLDYWIFPGFFCSVLSSRVSCF